MLRTLRGDPLVRMLGHTTVVLLLSTVAYYAVPLRFDRLLPWTAARAAAVVLMLTLLVLLFRAQIRWSRRRQRPDYLRIQWLLSALYGLVLVFALVYAALAVQVPGQLVGIADRTDALYFSVTIVATVGFGDIYAAGTAARLITTVQMVVNLIYIGTAVHVLASRAPRPPAPGQRGED